MKDKPREIEEDRLAGLIETGSEFKGDLTFKGSFRIEGLFQGNINSDSLLVVGEKGKVEAEINVGHLVVNGEVRGTLQAKEKIEIHNKGRVFGKIITPRLIVEEGAFIDANCQTQSVQTAAQGVAQGKKEEKSPS